MTDSVTAIFKRPKAQNVPAPAVAAATQAQRNTDDQTRDLARREAAARNARNRGRSLLLFDSMRGVDGLDPNRREA